MSLGWTSTGRRCQLTAERDSSVSRELLADVLTAMGSWPADIQVLQEGDHGNCCWLVSRQESEPFVLRRYDDRATVQDLTYEHTVMRRLGAEGWVVPVPVGEMVRLERWWWVATRFVPGQAIRTETIEQRRRRGKDLARLHSSLRALSDMGQRPGWRAQHTSPTVHTSIDWKAVLQAFAGVHPELADWATAAEGDSCRKLLELGATDLPTLVVHGDFHELNVHYDGRGLTGVIDFGLTHVDSRPYELAIARTHRSPEVIGAFREESARLGWPLSDLEEACIEPIRSAFRVDMVAWALDHGARVGEYDLPMIESQLSKTSTPRP